MAGLETFCKWIPGGTSQDSMWDDQLATTDFGLDDIAFYTKDDTCLLCTITHEGYILAAKGIIEGER